MLSDFTDGSLSILLAAGLLSAVGPGVAMAQAHEFALFGDMRVSSGSRRASAACLAG